MREIELSETAKKRMELFVNEVKDWEEAITIVTRAHGRARRNIFKTLRKIYPEENLENISFHHPDDGKWSIIFEESD